MYKPAWITLLSRLHKINIRSISSQLEPTVLDYPHETPMRLDR